MASTMLRQSLQAAPDRQHPLTTLPPDDLALITELVLNSGSLKALAKAYGVSYPTIRGRLDAVIRRLRDAIEGRERDPVAELLAEQVERGETSPAAARALLKAIRERDAAGPPAPETAGSTQEEAAP